MSDVLAFSILQKFSTNPVITKGAAMSYEPTGVTLLQWPYPLYYYHHDTNLVHQSLARVIVDL